MEIIKSVLYFILAGLCEIGGGYLIWLWLRDSGSFWVAILGGIILVLYGIVATFNLQILEEYTLHMVEFS